jgi:PAS fold
MSRELRPRDLKTTLERVSVPSALVDRSGTVTWQNRAALETVGDLVGKLFASIVAPEYQGVAQRQLERLLVGKLFASIVAPEYQGVAQRQLEPLLLGVPRDIPARSRTSAR